MICPFRRKISNLMFISTARNFRLIQNNPGISELRFWAFQKDRSRLDPKFNHPNNYLKKEMRHVEDQSWWTRVIPCLKSRGWPLNWSTPGRCVGRQIHEICTITRCMDGPMYTVHNSFFSHIYTFFHLNTCLSLHTLKFIYVIIILDIECIVYHT